MEEYPIIESLQNPRVKAAVKLRKAKIRNQTGHTLVEGFREIRRAVESGWIFNELYHCPTLYIDPAAAGLVSNIRNSGIPVYPCSEAVFRKMSYRDSPDGLMALSPLVGKKLKDLELPDHPLVLIAEDLEKPGNLGTILRTAEAAGVDAVIVCNHKTDLSNPNVIRASIGTLFFIPVAEATTAETWQWLNERGIQTLAATPADSEVYTGVDMRRGTAIVVGSEDHGLSAEWIQHADRKVGIPMQGRNDSLNVSTAAAILLYEAVRQRRPAF